MILSGRYSDPYKRAGDSQIIRESWHVCINPKDMFKYALLYDADLLLGKVSIFSLLTENGFNIKSTFTDINKRISVIMLLHFRK